MNSPQYVIARQLPGFQDSYVNDNSRSSYDPFSDGGVSTNDENNGWNDLPMTYGIFKIEAKHLIYPNFPHVYNWELDILTKENIEDVIDIALKSMKRGYMVDPCIIFYCAFEFFSSCKKQHETVARAFGCFLLAYVKRSMNRDETIQPLLNLPNDLLTEQKWCHLFQNIKIADFLRYVVPAMFEMRMIPNKCQRSIYQVTDNSKIEAYEDSLAFVTLTLKMFIREMNNVTPTIVTDIIDCFKNFAVLGNLLVALPFSFFAPSHIIHKYLSISDELRLSSAHRKSLNFMLGFRDINSPENKEPAFRKYLPNYLYIDWKLSILQESMNCIFDACVDYQVMIKSIKTLGIMPFKIIHRRKFSEQDKCAIESLITKYHFKDRNWNKIARKFYALDVDDSDYYAKTLKPTREIEDIGFDESTNSTERDENEDEITTCVVCLSEVSTNINVPCLHKVCCENCIVRLDRCPLCRAKIVLRLENNELNTYDRLQLLILLETYSMFAKILIK